MEKESPGSGVGGGGLPPHSSRHAAFASSPSSFREPSSSASPVPVATPETGHFSQNVSQDASCFSHDISRMLDFPPRNFGHRRARSEILDLPDDISFDSELGVVGPGDGPSLSDETEEDLFSMYIDMEKFSSPQTENLTSGSNERPRVRHQYSQSMDGSTSIKPELLVSSVEGPSSAEAKKAMSATKLAELALIDPKRAKRIWANRQSAARSKERKMRYITELEQKMHTLQTGATTLSAQLTMLQRDTNGLTAENNELKLRVQTMEQQVHLQDALNDALREEVQRLKLATGQAHPNGGQRMNFGPSSFQPNHQSYNHNQAMQSLLATHQLQQLQLHSQQLYQQQLQFNPHQHQQQQPPAELKMKGAISSHNQWESTSDNSSAPEEG